jgi:hypothetical protein
MPAKKDVVVTLEAVPVVMACGCVIWYRVSPPIVGDEVLCLSHGGTVVVKQARRRNVGRTLKNTVRHD